MSISVRSKCVGAVVAAAAAVTMTAGGAYAQDTAYVPFKVNADATVKAKQGGDSVSISVTKDIVDTLKLPLGSSSSVRYGGGAQGRTNAPMVTGSRGNITLRLPAQSYQSADVALHSINGKRVLRGKADAAKTAGNTLRRNVAAGVYILKVSGANGGTFAARLTHGGGDMKINVAFGGESASPARQLAKSAAAAEGDWDITISAGGYVSYSYTLSPVSGVNPTQDITLQTGIVGLTMDNYPRIDGSTSTDPLNHIIAAKLLGLEYEWREEYTYTNLNGNEAIASARVRDVVFKNSTELPSSFRNKIKRSQTNGAIINLIDGETDLIIVARKMSADEKQHAHSAGVSLIETPVALDALDFILNAENTVNSLTVKQIQDIYLGNITNWSEVGGADEAIVPYIRNANSGSQEMMNEIVMNNTGMADWTVSYTDEMAIQGMMPVYLEILTHPYGICFTPHYYKEYMVILEDVQMGGGDIKTPAVNGITPDANTIENKTYPFAAEVYVSIRSDLDHNSTAYKLYQWLQTEEGKSVIRESGYVPN